MDTVIARTRNRLGDRGIVMTGLRGVGKTVLLNEMASFAERAEWLTVRLEARRDPEGAVAVRRALARDLVMSARRLQSKVFGERMTEALRTIGSFNAKVGATGISLGVELGTGRADSGDAEVDLLELVEDVSTNLPSGRTFAIFVDEMQDLDPATLGGLIAAQHAANQRDWPFFVIAAGLPNLPRVLTETRSYAERLFNFRLVGPLSDEDAASALREPAEILGARYEEAALSRLLVAAGGYPYFIQEYGQAAWNLAATKVITVDDADTAVQLGTEHLDGGFFQSRWERATPSERRFLYAMAADAGRPSLSSEIADRVGLKITSLGPTRASLISKGLVYSPEHGRIAYTVPGMAEYVWRHDEDLDAQQ